MPHARTSTRRAAARLGAGSAGRAPRPGRARRVGSTRAASPREQVLRPVASRPPHTNAGSADGWSTRTPAPRATISSLWRARPSHATARGPPERRLPLPARAATQAASATVAPGEPPRGPTRRVQRVHAQVAPGGHGAAAAPVRAPPAGAGSRARPRARAGLPAAAGARRARRRALDVLHADHRALARAQRQAAPRAPPERRALRHRAGGAAAGRPRSHAPPRVDRATPSGPQLGDRERVTSTGLAAPPPAPTPAAATAA